MFALLIFSLSILTVVSYSFSNPDCINCKSYISNKLNENLGYCKIFTNKVYFNKDKEILRYNFAKHCRDNEYLCGKNGILFEQVDSKQDNNYVDLMDKKTIKQIEFNSRLFLDSQLKNIDNNSNLYLNNFNEEEKKSFKLYCKNNLKNNLPRKYKK